MAVNDFTETVGFGPVQCVRPKLNKNTVDESCMKSVSHLREWDRWGRGRLRDCSQRRSSRCGICIRNLHKIVRCLVEVKFDDVLKKHHLIIHRTMNHRGTMRKK